MSSTNSSNPGIGDAGELWLASQLPLDWVWQPPRRDVGKDGIIVIKDKTELNNIEFSVQVKTTSRPLSDKGSLRVSGLSTAAILYWFSSPQPTLIVVVDIEKKQGWYAWHLDLFRKPSEISGKRSCSIKVPLTNSLDALGWQRIRQRLQKHYDGLTAALHTAHVATKIVPLIRIVATATRDLVWLGQEPERPRREDFSPSDGDSVFLLIHDQCCYKDIIDAVRAARSLFHPDSPTYKQLSLWLAAFESHVLTAYPGFVTFQKRDDYAGMQITFQASMLKSTRKTLISASLEVVALLSGGAPEGAG